MRNTKPIRSINLKAMKIFKNCYFASKRDLLQHTESMKTKIWLSCKNIYTFLGIIFQSIVTGRVQLKALVLCSTTKIE
jgi:hypothetical protein